MLNEYIPTNVSSPGEILEEELQVREMTQADLARRMGRPLKTINEIIQGKTAIKSDTALQLERVLGIPASLWNNLESQYRDSLARNQESQQLQKGHTWLKNFPLRAMIKRGWVAEAEDKIEQMRLMLQFFSVASVELWHLRYDEPIAAFRRPNAGAANQAAVAAWLRQGEIQAQQISCVPYNAGAFQKALSHIRELTTTPFEESRSELVRSCAAVGVAVVFVKELPQTGVCGATRWLTSHKVLIQLSYRYMTEDNLWYTFFHEAGHILLHRGQNLFLEGDKGNSDKQVEAEADQFAANVLIRQAVWSSFVQAQGYSSKAGIEIFARKMGIAPGIIVGRLQHEGLLQYRYYNDLKRKLTWQPETAKSESAVA